MLLHSRARLWNNTSLLKIVCSPLHKFFKNNIYSHFSLITDSILNDYPVWLIGRKDTIRYILQIYEMIGGDNELSSFIILPLHED